MADAERHNERRHESRGDRGRDFVGLRTAGRRVVRGGRCSGPGCGSRADPSELLGACEGDAGARRTGSSSDSASSRGVLDPERRACCARSARDRRRSWGSPRGVGAARLRRRPYARGSKTWLMPSSARTRRRASGHTRPRSKRAPSGMLPVVSGASQPSNLERRAPRRPCRHPRRALRGTRPRGGQHHDGCEHDDRFSLCCGRLNVSAAVARSPPRGLRS